MKVLNVGIECAIRFVDEVDVVTVVLVVAGYIHDWRNSCLPAQPHLTAKTFAQVTGNDEKITLDFCDAIEVALHAAELKMHVTYYLYLHDYSLVKIGL